MRAYAVILVALGLMLGSGCGRTDLEVHVSGADGTGGTETEDGTLTDGPTTTFTTTGPTSGDDLPPPPTTITATDTNTTVDPPPPPLFCTIDLECDSPDPCLVGSCEDGVCVTVLRDNDEDGVPPPECGGNDCNDLNPNTFPGAPENCFDADDNDCNGVADCFDPACDGVPDCGCVPDPAGEECTGGADEDCDTTVDCNDSDCIGTPACGCAAAEAGLCVNGFDDDCDAAIDCNDPDCLPDPACTCMAQVEQCDDDADDDCDGLIDCADPDCEGLFPCTCLGPPVPENCSNGTDDDCDGLVDCADPACVVSAACAMCMPEQCTGGVDEDCDGKIDCADEACVFHPSCPIQPEICNNDLDDDFDGAIDCDDSDCFGAPICVIGQSNCGTAQSIFASGTFFGDTTGHTNNTEGTCGGGAGEAVFRLVLFQPAHVTLTSVGTSFDSVLYVRAGSCTVGQELGCDDDSGGFMWSAALDFVLLQPGNYFIFLDGYTIDPFGGPNEGPWQLNVEIIENPPEICNDVIDNDGDVYADCADPDCTLVPGCAGCVGGANPTAEFGVDACTDGLDNDCDGTIDCADEDCSASDFYVTECCNGTDMNDNGIPDDFNCRCNNDLECAPGHICYDHTADVCGIPCTSFFGDVCPFVAPGSTCNEATSQCEF
ncbi:MopE-related protein [Paraliomyxa miuraensis]|uniref:MopE-related protein n=1 Tax=Paraliomyxa miuraensis TaxID=376150 RepID=UPI00225623D1|nr:MopE-related protein [Paraliomyxa miuraensis]MCX4242267.1 MopE-related protein [Paraliomyxa miuraensis]